MILRTYMLLQVVHSPWKRSSDLRLSVKSAFAIQRQLLKLSWSQRINRYWKHDPWQEDLVVIVRKGICSDSIIAGTDLSLDMNSHPALRLLFMRPWLSCCSLNTIVNPSCKFSGSCSALKYLQKLYVSSTYGSLDLGVLLNGDSVGAVANQFPPSLTLSITLTSPKYLTLGLLPNRLRLYSFLCLLHRIKGSFCFDIKPSSYGHYTDNV